MREFLNEQYEGFIQAHNQVITDIVDASRELNAREFFSNLLVIILLMGLWCCILILYVGGTVVVGSILMFKYGMKKIRKIFNG
jgi:hypothetical protein